MIETLLNSEEVVLEKEEGRHVVYTFQNKTFRLDKEKARAAAGRASESSTACAARS